MELTRGFVLSTQFEIKISGQFITIFIPIIYQLTYSLLGYTTGKART